ncbi:hypothetical protein PRK78_001753 [Emydomyces testavorans]|uniref:Uncharacterized protein n=1 Tax=Emydomyces testavorans TaxID=2070801 RepID=A0AAF0DDC6_9EURO|nr:hypothetical protein PRK78_001753 [Emydomyces testavorans]
MVMRMDVHVLARRLEQCEARLGRHNQEVKDVFSVSQEKILKLLETGVSSIEDAVTSMDSALSAKSLPGAWPDTEQSMMVRSRQGVVLGRQTTRNIGKAFKDVAETADDLMEQFMDIQKDAIGLEVSVSVLQRDTDTAIAQAKRTEQITLEKVNAKAKERTAAKQKLDTLNTTLQGLGNQKDSVNDDRNVLRVVSVPPMPIHTYEVNNGDKARGITWGAMGFFPWIAIPAGLVLEGFALHSYVWSSFSGNLDAEIHPDHRELRDKKASIKKEMQKKQSEISTTNSEFNKLKSEEQEAQRAVENANQVHDQCMDLSTKVSVLKENVVSHIESYQKIKDSATELSLWADDVSVEAMAISCKNLDSMAEGLGALMQSCAIGQRQQAALMCEPIMAFQKLIASSSTGENGQ